MNKITTVVTKKIIVYVLAFCMVLSNCTGFTMNVHAEEGISDKMVWEMPAQYYSYNIKGDNEGTLLPTTYGNSGYQVKLIVDGKASKKMEWGMEQIPGTFDKMNPNEERFFEGIGLKINPTLVNNNYYVKVEYILTNTTDSEKTISLGSSADTQIGSNDSAPIAKFDDGTGFKMEGDGAQFNFTCKDAYGVTNVDTFWFGGYSNAYDSMFTQVDIDTYNGDSGMAYGWADRKIGPGETQKYSVLFGIGALNAAPIMLISTSDYGDVKGGDILTVDGTVSDKENTPGTIVYYAIDGGAQTQGHKFDSAPGEFNFTFTIPENLSVGEHFIDFLAQDSSGAVTSDRRTFKIPYVQAVVPQIESLTPNQDGSMDITINKNGNSDGIKYYIEYWADDTEATIKTGHIDWTTDLIHTNIALDNGTTYKFKVKAKNEDDKEIEYSEIKNQLTYPSIPTALTVTANSSKQMSISWDAVNGEVTKYKVYRDDSLIETVDAPTTTYTDTDETLNLNTAYEYAVSAVNGAIEGGAESEKSVSSTKYTLANKAGQAILQSKSNNTITLKLDKGDNQNTPKFKIVAKEVGNETNIIESTWTTSTTPTISGLDEGKDYYLYVSTSNLDLVENDETKQIRVLKGLGNINTGKPELKDVTIYSNNTRNNQYAKAGDIVTVEFTADEYFDLSNDSMVVTIAGQEAEINSIGDLKSANYAYKAKYKMTSTDEEGTVAFEIDLKNEDSLEAKVDKTTDSSMVIYDRTAPTTTSIKRNIQTDHINNTLDLTVEDNIFDSNEIKIMVSQRSDFEGGTWINFEEAYKYQLQGEDGLKRIYFKAKDPVGNESEVNSKTITLDREAPQIQIDYAEGYTDQDIVLDINITDSITGINEVNITSSATISFVTDGLSEGKLTDESFNGNTLTGKYTISSNGTYKITAKDSVGNTKIETITINKIDKTVPRLTLTPNTTEWTNKHITITVIGENDGSSKVDKITLASGQVISEIDKSKYTTTYTVTENGTYVFKVKNKAGNEITKEIAINNIDKKVPSFEYTLNTEEPTKYDVTINAKTDTTTGSAVSFILPDKSIAQGGSASYIVTENGAYTFTLTDEAANTTSAVVTISNIDKKAPIITGVKDGRTYHKSVNISFDEGIGTLTLNGDTSVNYTTLRDNRISDNGQYLFEAKDAAGNSSSVRFTIDIQELEIGYAPNDSAKKVTKDVTLPLACDDEGNVTWESDNEDIISVSGKVTRPSEDVKSVVVTLTAKIKKGNTVETRTFKLTVYSDIAPVITLNGQEVINIKVGGTYLEQGAKAIDNIEGDLTERIIITNNLDTSKVGEYIITYKVNDDEENISTVTRKVVVYRPSSSSHNKNKTKEPKEKVQEPKEEPQITFNDMENHWAKTYVEKLASMQIIDGDGAGDFNPNKGITRAEIATMLVKMSGKDIDLNNSDSGFSDVDISEWYAPYVVAARKMGVINGISETEFEPDRIVNRQEIVAMIMRYYRQTTNTVISEDEVNNNLSYKDSKDINDFAYNDVYLATLLNIVEGRENDEFVPTSETLRGEAATIIYRLLSVLGEL